jgi:hypothetical protein
MIVAISVWNHRIAPVFDVSRNALLCRADRDRLIREYMDRLPAADPVEKIHRLLELETEVLICGAISRNILELAEMYGIVTFPFTTGYVEEVESAFMQDRLAESGFARPGCRKCRRMRCRNGSHRFGLNKSISEE